MKTSFSLFSIAAVASYPAAIVAGFAGAPLPSGIASVGAFGFYVAGLIALALIRDYRTPSRLRVDLTPTPSTAKVASAAARETHRLAA